MYTIYKNSHKKSFLVCNAHDNKKDAMTWAVDYFHKKPGQLNLVVGYIQDDYLYLEPIEDYDFNAYVVYTK